METPSRSRHIRRWKDIKCTTNLVDLSPVSINLKQVVCEGISHRISQLTLKDSSFKTYRGITIGSRLKDVIDSYGQGEESVDDKSTTNIVYCLEDMRMIFSLDDEQIVDRVSLYIWYHSDELLFTVDGNWYAKQARRTGALVWLFDGLFFMRCQGRISL